MTNVARTFPSRSLLPPEIISLIVTAIGAEGTIHHHYKQALSAASRVCKYWFFHLQHLLWRRLELRSESDIRGLLQLAGRPGCMVRQWVREVHITPGCWTYALLTALGWQLPRLDILHYYPDIYSYRDQDWAECYRLPLSMSSFKTLKVLVLENVIFHTLQLFIHSVSSLPLLEGLTCWNIDFRKRLLSSHGWHERLRRKKINHRLSTILCNNSIWLAPPLLWLLSTSSRGIKTSIRFPMFEKEDLAVLMTLVERSGPSWSGWKFLRTDGE